MWVIGGLGAFMLVKSLFGGMFGGDKEEMPVMPTIPDNMKLIAGTARGKDLQTGGAGQDGGATTYPTGSTSSVKVGNGAKEFASGMKVGDAQALVAAMPNSQQKEQMGAVLASLSVGSATVTDVELKDSKTEEIERTLHTVELLKRIQAGNEPQAFLEGVRGSVVTLMAGNKEGSDKVLPMGGEEYKAFQRKINELRDGIKATGKPRSADGAQAGFDEIYLGKESINQIVEAMKAGRARDEAAGHRASASTSQQSYYEPTHIDKDAALRPPPAGKKTAPAASPAP